MNKCAMDTKQMKTIYSINTKSLNILIKINFKMEIWKMEKQKRRKRKKRKRSERENIREKREGKTKEKQEKWRIYQQERHNNPKPSFCLWFFLCFWEICCYL